MRAGNVVQHLWGCRFNPQPGPHGNSPGTRHCLVVIPAMFIPIVFQLGPFWNQPEGRLHQWGQVSLVEENQFRVLTALSSAPPSRKIQSLKNFVSGLSQTARRRAEAYLLATGRTGSARKSSITSGRLEPSLSQGVNGMSQWFLHCLKYGWPQEPL